MRAPFQVLVFPYRQRDDGAYEFAVFRRSDLDFWQGIAGGGEDDEAPIEAARREALEEGGIAPDSPFIPLDTLSSIPAMGFRDSHLWNRYVIPEYAFGVNASGQELLLSPEHTDARWLLSSDAQQIVKYDGNRVALWELHQRLIGLDSHDATVSPSLCNQMTQQRMTHGAERG